MPIVTLPAPGNVPTGPGPVLNNQQLPRFDTRGEQQALERLGGAMAMPMMDKSAALPYEALGAVGEAISQTGSIMAAYVKKKTDAESEIVDLEEAFSKGFNELIHQITIKCAYISVKLARNKQKRTHLTH